MKNQIILETVNDLFEKQVLKNPEKIAVISREKKLTYEELNNRANALANRIFEIDDRRNSVIAIKLSRSIDCVVAIIGVLKSGKAYIFFEPDFPRERMKFILKQSSVKLLVTDQKKDESRKLNVHTLIINNNTAPIFSRNVERFSDDLAYVVYTSGSTGEPKGVMVENRNLINYFYGITERIQFDKCQSYAHLTTFSADLGNTILYISLLKGACLHVLPNDIVFDPQRFSKYISTHKIDCYKSVPSHLTLMIENSDRNFLPKKVLISGGENLNGELAKELLSRLDLEGKIYNHYGPSETCIGILTYEISSLDNFEIPIPIGKPINNVRCYVLDNDLNYVSINTPGELYVAGASLGRGYVHDKDLTESKFFKNKFKKEDVLYRTGDVVKVLPSGNIQFIQRRDKQIKINGYRVELEEIENKIRKHSKVNDVIVQNYSIERNKNLLTAFVKPNKKYFPFFDETENYMLPNGLAVNHLNKNETDYLYREIFELEAYDKYGIDLNEGDIVFDVGANIGLFSLFIYSLEKKVKIYAFEPNPEAYELMDINLSRYDVNYSAYNAGLSFKEDTKDFGFYSNFSILSGYYVDEDNEKNVIKKYVKNQNKNNHSNQITIEKNIKDLLEKRFDDKKIIETKLFTLSKIINEENIRIIDLLKINVEKSELDVLQGINNEDWSKIRQLILEVDTEENYHEIIKLLNDKNFIYYTEKDTLLEDTNLCYIYAFSQNFKHSNIRKNYEKDFQWDVSVNQQNLHEYLLEYLPHYMIPKKYIFLESFPLTSNGKLDRNKLKIILKNSIAIFVAPKNDLENKLSIILKELLNIDKISITENFFAYGMDSINAITMKTKLLDYGFELEIHDIFNYNTISLLAKKIETLKRDGQRVNSVSRISKSFKSYIGNISSMLEHKYYPSTHDHLMNWRIYQMDPSYLGRNSSYYMELDDENGVEHIIRIFDFLVNRHDAFRTSFTSVDDVLYQVVCEKNRLKIRVEDISRESNSEKENILRKIVLKENSIPFHLEEAPIFRCKIVKTNQTKHFIICTSHHIVVDGWSVDIIKKEILLCHQKLLNGEELSLPELELQFKHYSMWKDEFFKDPSLNKEEHNFWIKNFHGFKKVVHLPYDFEKIDKKSIESEGFVFYLDGNTKNSLATIAKDNNSSIYMILFSSAYLLLYKRTGYKDLTLGMPHVDRSYKEVQRIIGEFAGPIPIRLQLNEKDKFSLLLKKVTEQVFNTINRLRYPSLFLKELLQLDCEYQFSLLMGKHNDEEYKTKKIIDFSDRFLPSIYNARFEMAIYPREYENGIELLMKYHKKYFKKESIESYINEYRDILYHIANNKDFELSKTTDIGR